jgi:predicted nucleotidyltransferase
MDQRIKHAATNLLESTGILNILAQFGEVHIVGSYAFDLMTEPDIDLIVLTDEPRKSSEETLAFVSKLHLFQKLEYGDFQKFPREKRPPFFIVNMRTPWEGEMFEIETWFLPEAAEQLAFVEKIKKISPEQRRKIIELKLKRKQSGTSKTELSSFNIYKSVLGF